MGRPRKPASLKILEGREPARPEAPAPESPAGIGEAPAWLDATAKLAWARLAELMEPMNLATVADRELLGLYCVTYSVWYRALAKVEAEGFTIDTKFTRKAHPCLAIAQEAQRQLARMLSKFGMSPGDRAGLHIQERPEDDELLRFLASPGPDAAATPRRARTKAQ